MLYAVKATQSSLQMGFNSFQKLQFYISLLKQGSITVLHVFENVYLGEQLNDKECFQKHI